jgi:hypothetical protein
MTRDVSKVGAAAAVGWAGVVALSVWPAASGWAAAKYYFKVVDIKSTAALDQATKAAAREVLEKDLAGRPEFTADIGAAGDANVVDELKRRRLQGFNVTLRIDELKKESKPPKPGGRLKQLAVSVKLSVFGTTLPGAKLAFGGDGEAAIESEVVESRLESEAAGLVKDVMVQAVRQAVDQAVAKLSLPKSQPFNESKRKRKKAGG